MSRQKNLLLQNRPVFLHSFRYFCREGCLILLLLLTANTGQAEDKTVELESIRNRIKEVQTELDTAYEKSDRLQEELRKNEIAAGRQALKLQEIEQAIANKRTRLAKINEILTEHEQAISTERRQLAQQIRSAYMTGRGDYLKLLLNQEDHALVGRVLAYHDYYNRAHTKTINDITRKMALIKKLRSNLQDETEMLENLRIRQIDKSKELAAYRESREKILANLKKHINEQGLQLKSLQENEKQLSALLEELDVKKDDVIFFENIPPFHSLKGKLNWPINGKLLNRFGSMRRGAALKWQGVKISAKAGNEVRAVHTGKVVFADWFRNLGLLIILDHGDGYMSLYGYNQNLLKKAGDWVLAGETIALAGDSGGQNTPGVYFEIRHRGKPLNPALWCKK